MTQTTENQRFKALSESIYLVSEMGRSKYDSLQSIVDILKIVFDKTDSVLTDDVVAAAGEIYKKKFTEMVSEG